MRAGRHAAGLARSPGAGVPGHSAEPPTGADEEYRRGERTRTVAQVHAFPLPPAEISCTKNTERPGKRTEGEASGAPMISAYDWGHGRRRAGRRGDWCQLGHR